MTHEPHQPTPDELRRFDELLAQSGLPTEPGTDEDEAEIAALLAAVDLRIADGETTDEHDLQPTDPDDEDGHHHRAMPTADRTSTPCLPLREVTQAPTPSACTPSPGLRSRSRRTSKPVDFPPAQRNTPRMPASNWTWGRWRA
ncbi:hypothetical protein BJY24_002785 [Nocardia transvalensis]|uniref:Uncharacterized protein n=1 Tax=Nocardia transvalensis TaxID=37333 RepID=A0A7W9PDY2_9NOCA|nr:hypothetical protein [Nocardia transvalensis]MBB5913918.1 hypothetical protein [Nocardia transvalensis]